MNYQTNCRGFLQRLLAGLTRLFGAYSRNDRPVE